MHFENSFVPRLLLFAWRFLVAIIYCESGLQSRARVKSRGISLVGAAEGLAAQLDALDSQAPPDDPADGETAAGHQCPANRPEGGSGKRF
jgi:hypothetical protein